MDATLRAIRLNVNKYAECLEFYRDVLGFKLHWGDDSTLIADFMLGSTMLAICRVAPSESGARRGSDDRVTIVLRVDDLDEEYARLKQRGVEFVTEPEDMPALHVRGARFRDPEGNLLEINVRLSG